MPVSRVLNPRELNPGSTFVARKITGQKKNFFLKIEECNSVEVTIPGSMVFE